MHQEHTVADAMLRFPKLWDRTLTVGAARNAFADDHVHALLVVDGGVLVSVVERADLRAAPADRPAAPFGRLHGRVVGPGADLCAVRRSMPARRLAVVDDGGRLLGLLCLKRSGHGFCSDDGVRARAAAAGHRVQR